MTRSRIGLAVGCAAAVLCVAVTLLALEGHEVVVVRTFDAHGTARETRTWVADAEGFTWIEAANSARPFLLDVQVNPQVELRRSGTLQSCQATIMENPGGHERIRHLLAARYGWADSWIGLLTDTAGSVAIRLHCTG